MIRIERDPAFWERVASHPAVAPSLMGIEPQHFAVEAVGELLLPLASEHGGFVFVPRDAMGRVVELHTLYTPEGWGREAAMAGKAALAVVFDRYDLVLTYERIGDWRTRPPRSFGFRPCGEAFEMYDTQWRTWQLSREGWRVSPVFSRSVN